MDAEAVAAAPHFDAAPRDWVRPVTLEGSIVRLEPMSLEHLEGLVEVGLDPAIWRWTIARPKDVDDLGAWMETALANQAVGTELPFVTVDRATSRPIGSTRFLSIVPEHRRLEIGWTWVAPAWQRRGANQEAKYLQLRHAFEELGANRVEFKTDSRNEKANPALLSIGARFEGTFRNHMIMPDGPLRHSNYYAIAVEDWPRVRSMLEARIESIVAALEQG
ncbi:MAG TPA: GNAT family N-acetyltransferase [Candidatus Binatia bacterium]|nr:GNAT family N-acetyltransferase [Candidatus Binatia bacterium]